MEATDTPDEFWKQFAGSGSANMLTIVALGLLWGMRKLCSRDSRCKSHVDCCCLDFDMRDRTIREPPEMKDEGETELV